MRKDCCNNIIRVPSTWPGRAGGNGGRNHQLWPMLWIESALNINPGEAHINIKILKHDVLFTIFERIKKNWVKLAVDVRLL